MPSWYSSWLPDFPSVNFTVPSGLQGRFVSFVLKKCLGHFLKAGQLDVRQIESQIGSGFVQINDLELNNEAINSFLAGLPLVLHDGFISSITARVPWPNPLTSNLGLSLDALHLTFHVVPNITTPSQGADLAESVASAAETFMHEELVEQEDATLLDSVHTEVSHDIDGAIPGGLDHFVSSNEGVAQTKDDSTGAPLFSSLLEKLLARFEFNAVNTEITLVHPGNVSLTLSIAEIRYGTEANVEANQSSSESGHPTLALSGVRVTTRDLRPHASPSLAGSYTGHSPPIVSSSPKPRHVDRPDSPAASSSSLDEETQEFMSRSIVSFPPRSGSLGSASSSLYQSAFSEESGQRNPLSFSKEFETQDDGLTSSQDDADQSALSGICQADTLDDVLLSFGSVPLVIRILTPPSNDANGDGSSNTRSSLKLNVSMGAIGLACNARQLASIIAIAGCFNTQRAAKPSPRANSDSIPPITHGPNWNFDVGIEGLAVLLLPASLAPKSRSSLTGFFARPLTLPHISDGYVRLYIGGINAEIASNEDFSNSSHQGGKTSQAGTSANSSLRLGLKCGDINASVHSFPSLASKMLVYPILFADYRLRHQYIPPRIRPKSDGCHVGLPTLPVNGRWAIEMQDDGLNLSPWSSALLSDDVSDNALEIGEKTPPTQRSADSSNGSAISVSIERTTLMERGRQPQLLQDETSISIRPLHLILDIEHLSDGQVVAFMQELAGGVGKDSTSNKDSGDDGETVIDDDQDMTPLSAATTQLETEKEKEGKRPGRLILEDTHTHPELGEFGHARTSIKRRIQNHSRTSFSITFMMIRAELRCSPPSRHLPSRSGTLVADFHRLKFISEDRPDARTTRFTIPSVHPHPDSLSSVPLARVQCSDILFGFCPVRETVASVMATITSLHDCHEQEAMDNDSAARKPLEPRMFILKEVHPNDPATFVVNIPSIYVNLSKEALDGLLVWADDATQLMERMPSSQHIKRTASTGLAQGDNSSQKANPLRINISTTEVVVRLMVPHTDGIQSDKRPFDISASDLTASIELRPGSTEESVVDVDIMDLMVENASSANEFQTILARTAPHNLSSPKSTLSLKISSLARPGSDAKETRLNFILCGVTGNIFSDTQWINDLNSFVKSPPGVFEAVVPSEKTSILLRLQESSVRAYAPTHPGALLLHVGDLEFRTDIIGSAIENAFHISIPNLSLLTVDDMACCEDVGVAHQTSGVSHWKYCGYALVAEVTDSAICFIDVKGTTDTQVVVEKINLRVHLCADTLTAVLGLVNDWQQNLKPIEAKETPIPRPEPTVVSDKYSPSTSMISSVEDIALRRLPEIGPAPDMINDDLPTNIDYLDESFSATAGLRELRDEDLDDFSDDHDFEADLASSATERSGTGIISRVRGETVKMMRQEGIQVVENFFESLPTDTSVGLQHFGDTTLQIRAYRCNLALLLYDGYDWVKTRKTIEREVKDMRRRLAKFKQLVASGQTPDSSVEEMSTVLFNSVYIGLDQDVDSFEPAALIAAIDEQLNDDIETASQSSWQSLRPHAPGKPRPKSIRVHGRKLTRSKGPSMEFVLRGANVEVDHYRGSDELVSRTFAAIEDVEILDHIKTSTWRKFLTALQVDSRGNTRETDSSMVRVELRNVRPVPGHPAEEVRLRAKILPLRLYVDQDAVDFLKKFFSFKDPNAPSEAEGSNSDETYIQFAEVFPILLKLDYKPRRVDYKALREGRTIELMNFFHFDGAEMTLRHITLSGIMGWPRLFELLNDLWTPDVKATQLVDVISGVSPIRSVVNVGSGVADLVLLPITQYKKDGRILRGLQKGTTAFFKSTALEAIKLGAKLATGTQVILEQAEGVLGGQFQQTVTTETIQEDELFSAISDDEGRSDAISRYADQPRDITEGVHSAYHSLRKNFGSAAQTILAVPMEVYERSGDEGAIRSVIRAVPIAVLKPMIGATEAVSKTLLGLHNTLEPNVRHDNQAKYKQQR